ncbi:hypothetical protein [Rubellicoccus peritrichatus]|uniref:Lipid A biosynthesis acyltransferase n=1 Tax=Rubellicoccus peritrichatus TaxID=3080537 RepID=A0AAQ3LE71_9BACT|nr:hypothetical protein [Puniceicoccus sp. CR14]WOO42325.1 hypothetical protein RZN69_04430 [Puniceicoccus sp. CR14]
MSSAPPRNPGPSWGFDFLQLLNRFCPAPLRDGFTAIGSSVAWAFMPKERAASMEYLSAVTGKPCSKLYSLKHFANFTALMMAKLRAGDGKSVTLDWASSEDAENGAILFSDQQLLLGTFHVGGSEFLGFHNSALNRKVAMIRQRRNNSGDIDRLVERSSGNLKIIWVDPGDSVVFALRDLIAEGYSPALQCDRLEHSSKSAVFDFLGRQRRMPFTIYRLALLYELPVCFCVALPGEKDLHYQVKAFSPFYPVKAEKSDQLKAAETHFQGVLHWLEQILAQHPLLWFNFMPLSSSMELTEKEL